MTGVQESGSGTTKGGDKSKKAAEPKKAAKGKGKGKTADGKPYCFSWNRCRDGACKDLGLKSKCPANREHICEFCDSPDHKSKDCPKKPDWAKW